jgi:hypothetical protein
MEGSWRHFLKSEEEEASSMARNRSQPLGWKVDLTFALGMIAKLTLNKALRVIFPHNGVGREIANERGAGCQIIPVRGHRLGYAGNVALECLTSLKKKVH